jgi:hypothetical protein
MLLGIDTFLSFDFLKHFMSFWELSEGLDWLNDCS